MNKFLFAICLTGLCVLSCCGQHSFAQEELTVGDKAPDFEVETIGDATTKLSDRFGDSGNPTILLFSRANW